LDPAHQDIRLGGGTEATAGSSNNNNNNNNNGNGSTVGTVTVTFKWRNRKEPGGKDHSFSRATADTAFELCSLALQQPAPHCHCRVISLTERVVSVRPPAGLNTVALLRMASGAMKVSPHKAMQLAERLYLAGLISYPRTESSRYPSSWDIGGVVKQHVEHQGWGHIASAILKRSGGDHVRSPR
jgi:DNA topoisomerase IA